MKVVVADDEQQVLLSWRLRTDTLRLIRMQADTVLLASQGVGLDTIAMMVARSPRTVRRWLGDWNRARMSSVVTGHQGNQNAAKLTRDQKEQLREVLAQPPSESGVSADFWDVPALADVVRTRFDVEYKSDSSYRLLMHLAGHERGAARPVRQEARREGHHQADGAGPRGQVKDLLDQGWEIYTVDEVRVEHEAETRRMWLPTGERTKIHVDRTRNACSFFGALSLTTKKVKVYPLEGNQNAGQVISALNRLVRETDREKIAVVLDDAGLHHAKAVTDLFEPGQQAERITPILLPPYAPDPGPVEHVWNAAKSAIANTPTRHPRRDLHGVHRPHHRPHLRLRLRAPTKPHPSTRFRLIPAIHARTNGTGLGRFSRYL